MGHPVLYYSYVGGIPTIKLQRIYGKLSRSWGRRNIEGSTGPHQIDRASDTYFLKKEEEKNTLL